MRYHEFKRAHLVVIINICMRLKKGRDGIADQCHSNIGRNVDKSSRERHLSELVALIDSESVLRPPHDILRLCRNISWIAAGDQSLDVQTTSLRIGGVRGFIHVQFLTWFNFLML
jgi:hypothetical protein